MNLPFFLPWSTTDTVSDNNSSIDERPAHTIFTLPWSTTDTVSDNNSSTDETSAHTISTLPWFTTDTVSDNNCSINERPAQTIFTYPGSVVTEFCGYPSQETELQWFNGTLCVILKFFIYFLTRLKIFIFALSPVTFIVQTILLDCYFNNNKMRIQEAAKNQSVSVLLIFLSLAFLAVKYILLLNLLILILPVCCCTLLNYASFVHGFACYSCGTHISL